MTAARGSIRVAASRRRCAPQAGNGLRDELRDATEATKLPAFELPGGTVITHSRAILSWIDRLR